MSTKKVRIAVAIDETGDWYAVGWDELRDRRLRCAVSRDADLEGEAKAVYFVEAEIPLPTLDTPPVQGKVVPCE